MGRTLMALVIAVCTCLLVLRFVAPRLLSPGSAPSSAASTSSGSGADSASSSASSALPPITATGLPGGSGPNLAPPQTPEQKALADYEAQRAPLYTFLREKCGSLIVEGRPALDDRSILSLYTTRSDDRIVTDILAQVVTPYVYGYGFRHVRFYLPNPPGSVERYHLTAEANADESGNWQAFQK
jgi:hypothetical protein